jgi:hypothetical protein
MANFTDLIRMLSDGEQVDAGTTNRPLRALDQNIRYLKDLFDSAIRGDTLIAHDQTVESTALVGMPVFYNSTTQRFERAIGNTEVDEDTGAFVTSESTQVWGIVRVKHSATNADILLHGMAEIDLSNAISGTITPGVYYLSNSTKGALVKQRPAVGVSVLQAGPETEEGLNLVYVSTKFLDLLEAHRHFKFTLSVLPSGDTSPPAVNGTHSITSADDSIEGWLPADHSSFGGKAPEDAKFGYNIAASKLNGLWPPMPVEGTHMELYPGGEELGSAIPIGEGELVQVDRNGIWWMKDCYGSAPWATDFDSSVVSSASESDCPVNGERRIILWFTRPVFNNTGTWVSSLVAKDGSGLLITCVDNGDEASTGHLIIDLDLGLRQGSANNSGYIVIKELENGQFLRGPVVESLKPVGDNVTLTTTVEVGSDGKRYGNISIAVNTDLNAGEVNVDVSRLEGVEETYFNHIIGLGFPQGRVSSMRCRLVVPAALSLPEGTKLKLILWVLNRSDSAIRAGTFQLSYRIISNPGSTPTSLPLEASETTMTAIPAADIEMTATNQYVAIETGSLDVTPGDEILFNITRDGDEDGLASDLHVLRQYGKYVLPS